MDPKALRAEARKLILLARTIEMAQDPHKAMQKKVNQKVAGMKRSVKYGLAKSLTSK